MPPMGPGGRPGGHGGGGPLGARVNREKPKNTARTLGRLLKYIGKSKMLIILLIIIMVAVTASDLSGPALQGAAIDTISIKNGQLSVDFSAMLGYLGIMAVLFVVSALLSFFQGIIAAKLMSGRKKWR